MLFGARHADMHHTIDSDKIVSLSLLLLLLMLIPHYPANPFSR